MRNRRNVSHHLRRTAVACAVVGALSSAPTTAAPAPAQTVRGHVTVPTNEYRVGGAAVAACPLAHAGVAWAARAGGAIAHEFRVDPATRGREFVLRPVRPARLVIRFDTMSVISAVGLDEIRGRVPLGARSAVVCLSAGAPTAFEYSAGVAS
jgi:hypothetical protein